MSNLTKLEAFRVMREFLKQCYEKKLSDDICDLLTGTNMNIWADVGTADPACWGEWLESIEKVLDKEGVETHALTVRQAFDATQEFLQRYYSQTQSEDIKIILNDMQSAQIDSPVWDVWINAVKECI